MLHKVPVVGAQWIEYLVFDNFVDVVKKHLSVRQHCDADCEFVIPHCLRLHSRSLQSRPRLAASLWGTPGIGFVSRFEQVVVGEVL